MVETEQYLITEKRVTLSTFFSVQQRLGRRKGGFSFPVAEGDFGRILELKPRARMRHLLGVACLVAVLAEAYGQGFGQGTYPMEGCIPGWTNFGKYCYKFFNQRMNWLQAQRECNKYSALNGTTPRGYLMTSKDQQHNNFQHNWLRYTGGGLNKVWLGLSEKTNNNYFWADGTPLLPTQWNKWKIDQPQLNAHIQGVHTFDNMVDMTWVTSFYKTEMSFICQYQYML